MTLPQGAIFRPATFEDRWPIRRMVLRAKLDPTQLRWQQFWVIEKDHQIIACGQLRNFFNAQELGSLVVLKKWQNQGLGTYLAQYLIESATKSLYLECLGKRLEKFYQRLGFIRADWQKLPVDLKRKFTLSYGAQRFLKVPIIIMKHGNSYTDGVP